MDIEKEFDSFFEFNTDDKTQVTSTSCKLFAEHVTESLRQQLALKDLEVMQLREDLKAIVNVNITQEPEWDMSDNNGEIWGMYLYRATARALSTTFTPDNLMAWYKEQLGEPVASAWMNNGAMVNAFNHPPNKDYDHDGYWKSKGYSKEPLYAPKLNMK